MAGARQDHEFRCPAEITRPKRGPAGKSVERFGERIVRLKDLQAAASVALLLMSAGTQNGIAQQPTPPLPNQTAPSATQPAPPQAVQNDTTGQPGLPQAPPPKLTEPLYLRGTDVDYTKPKSHFWNPIAPYTQLNYPAPSLGNTPKLEQLLRDGKIYLSLSDAVMLAIENNYDIAIARINLDIADTDILRAKAGSFLRGVSSGLVQNTLGGSTTTILTGGGQERPRPEQAARARARAVW